NSCAPNSCAPNSCAPNSSSNAAASCIPNSIVSGVPSSWPGFSAANGASKSVAMITISFGLANVSEGRRGRTVDRIVARGRRAAVGCASRESSGSTGRIANARHEIEQMEGWRHRELLPEKGRVGVELADGLRLVALREVGADQDAVDRFPERLGGNRRQSHVDGLGVVVPSDQLVTERLERMQPQLAQPLPLDDDPIVVPIGQDLAGEQQGIKGGVLKV